MKTLLFVSCLTGFILQSHGQAVDFSKIDKRDLKTFIKILTSDSLEGRETGSEGQKKAGRFISDKFNELGLKQFDENRYLQSFKLNQTHWGQVYIKTKSRTLQNFDNMVFQGRTSVNDETETELVFGGTGTDDELNQIEVKDRLVLLFVKNVRASDDINKRLRQRKASGVILANPENAGQFETIKNTLKDHILHTRLSIPEDETKQVTLAKWDTIRLTNTITIPNSEIRNLTGRSQKELAQLIHEKRIQDAPIAKLKIKFERIQNEIETANVIGIIEGETNKTIIVSAHYDHLGQSGSAYFPGADDNASGTSALLELAQHFSTVKHLKYNIMFIATSGEEAGLLGSLYHVNHPTFNAENILCNFNLDMISRIDEKHANGKYLYCIGTGQSKELDSSLHKADSLFSSCYFDYSLDDIKDAAGLFTRSDNYNFYKKGIPSLHFFSGLHADYHKPTDTADKIDFENLQNRVRLISLVIELMQNAEIKD
jgi:hypothetical protein